MKVGAIIQARMGSSRLPGKILMPLNGVAVLEHIYNRVNESVVDATVVATTVSELDDEVEKFCNDRSIPVFRGSENDVLDRYYQAAKAFGFDIVVRATADDPLKDTKVINKAIDLLLNGGYDYVSNTIHPTYPEGIDIEVFTFKALEKAHSEARLPSEHEHVTPYIWKNPDIYNTYNFENTIDLSKMRWTMDSEDDYQFMVKVYSFFEEGQKFDMDDVLNLLEKNPEISDINSGHIRNAGYIKSLQEESDNG